MQRGRKPELPQVKEARGTFRNDRDGQKQQVIVPNDPPAMPDHLDAEAQSVWAEELSRVMMYTVTEVDSSLFARYCCLEACVRSSFAEGKAPPAAYLTELRRMGELMGIAGPKSRIQTGNVQPKRNAFGNI